MDYQEFPKSLTHPAFKPAQKIQDAIQGGPGAPNLGFGQPEQWSPVMWPAVIVTTPDQEAEYLAKGYVAAGTSDPAAFSTAHASPFVAGRTTSKYPMMVDGKVVQDPDLPTSNFAEYPKWLKIPAGVPGAGEHLLVDTEADEKRLLAGWGTPAEDKPVKKTRAKYKPRKVKAKKDEQEQHAVL